MIRWIAFDADDTLWENEKYYYQGQKLLAEILSPFKTKDIVDEALLKKETANLPWYGYGIKSFGISMIETAIELSGGKVGSLEISKIIQHLRNMLAQPAELLEGVQETLDLIQADYKLMVITKGDLLDQERKLASSKLENYFKAYEVVSDKMDLTYEQILKKHAIIPSEFLMVGNSLRSDVLPVVKIGGFGVYVPHKFTWAHEIVEVGESNSNGYVQVNTISELPEVLLALANQ